MDPDKTAQACKTTSAIKICIGDKVRLVKEFYVLDESSSPIVSRTRGGEAVCYIPQCDLELVEKATPVEQPAVPVPSDAFLDWAEEALNAEETGMFDAFLDWAEEAVRQLGLETYTAIQRPPAATAATAEA